MPTLYYLPGSAAMAAHAALLEAGVQPELVRVVRENGVTVSPPDYLTLNPHGRVPALVDGDVSIYESAAIVLHAADRHPQSGLAPSDPALRSHFYKWLVHLTNTVQPNLHVYFAPGRITGAGASDTAKDAVKASVAGVIGEQLDWLDGEIAGKQFLLGDTFSGADLYLWMLIRWSRGLTPAGWDRPNLGAFYDRLSARPSVAAMLEQQGLEARPAA